MNKIHRPGLISYLAKKTPHGWLGRTALMKYCYLLQSVRGVPLGYRFTLHTYGPFDSSVLNDLGTADALGLVRSTFEEYPSGYGYRIESCVDPKKKKLDDWGILESHRDSIDWVLREFGSKNAADLELETTIIFVGRDPKSKNLDLKGLARVVHEVKPHFSEADIFKRTTELQDKGLLT